MTPPATTVEIQSISGPCFIERGEKRALLCAILARSRCRACSGVPRTKHTANKSHRAPRSVPDLRQAIHGNKSQSARQRALEAFRSRQIRVLVATDIAARGIDIDGITHVVNYELPMSPETHVHRVGRTARAGAPAGYSLVLRQRGTRLSSRYRAIDRFARYRSSIAAACRTEEPPRRAAAGAASWGLAAAKLTQRAEKGEQLLPKKF